MHDCTCTWEASDSNDISSSDCAMDFLKVLFCFSKGRGKRERQRKRGGGKRSRRHTLHLHIQCILFYMYAPCICHDLNLNSFPSQIVEDELPSTLPLGVNPSRHAHRVCVNVLPRLQMLVLVDKVSERGGDVEFVRVGRGPGLLLG